MSGYGRRAAAAGQQHMDTALFSQGSGDYNPLFFNQDLVSKSQASSILSAHQGPRPLDWNVAAAKSAGGAAPAAAGVLHWDQSSRNSSMSSSKTKETSLSTTWSPGMLQQQVPTYVAAAGYDAGRYQPQAAALAGRIAGFPGLGDNTVAAAAAAYRRRPAASTAAEAGPGRSSVVHGPEIAGYKSVVTKNPVSPSGYSVGMQPEAAPPAAAPAKYAGHSSAGAPAAAGYIAAGGSSGSSRTAPAAAAGVANPVAAAAAAALAALGGRGKHSIASTTAAAAPPPGGLFGSDVGAADAASGLHTGSFNTCSVPEFSIADVAAAAGLHEHSTWLTAEPAAAAASGPAAMLKWNVQARPPAQAAVAGRRADASRSRGGAGVQAAAVESDAPQHRQTNSAGFSSRNDAQEQQQQQQQRSHSSSSRYAAGSVRQQTPPDAGYDGSGSSSRPPSQQLTQGLSKLKQLSTARLATRLTTPLTNSIYGGCEQQSEAAGAGLGSSSSSSHRRTTSGGRCCSNAGVLHEHQQQQVWGESGGSSGYTPSSYSSGVQRTTSRGQQSMAGASLLAQAAVNGSGKSAASRGGAGSEAGFAAAAAASAQYETAHNEAPAQLQALDGDECGTAAELQQCGNCGRSFVASALQRHAKVCAKVFCQKRKVFNMQSQRLQGSEAAKFAPKDEVDHSWGQPQYNGSSSSKPGSAGRKPAGSSSSSGQRQRQAPSRAGPGSTSSNGRHQQQQQQQQQNFDSRPAMSAAAAKKSKWQQQSEQLRKAMRAGQGGSGSGGYGAGVGGGYPTEQAEEDNRIPCPHCGRRFAELAAVRHIPKCSEVRAKPTGLKAGGGKQSYMRSNSRR